MDNGGTDLALQRARGRGARRPGRRYLKLSEPIEGSDPRSARGRRINKLEELLLRVANFAVAAVALVALAPLILVIAVLIKLDSRGPVFYRQLRVGLDRRDSGPSMAGSGRRVNDLGGRPFQIVKFRTMHVDAERHTGPVWSTPGDARTTRIGRVLRRTRLDEIPQFWNVLRGEMSVVGPRPERPNFVLELRREIAEYKLRNRVRPGITGWAQVNQGYDQSLEDVRSKVGYDLEYVRRRSLWFDLVIMLKTLPVMFERDKG